MISYRPGNRLGIVRSGMIVVVERDTSTASIAEIWDLLSTRPTVDDVFLKLTAAFGQQIQGLPSFGIVAFSSELHVILRGPLHLATAPGPDASRISGNEVSRWSERRLPLQDFTLTSEEARPEGDSEPWLPVVEAVVPFGDLRLLSGAETEAGLPAAEPYEAAERPPEIGRAPAHFPTPEPEVDDAAPVPVRAAAVPVAVAPVPAAPAPALPASGDGVHVPAPGNDGDEGYDYLWGKTIVRTVEEAAMRDGEDGAGAEPALPALWAPAAEPGLQPAPEPAVQPAPEPAPRQVPEARTQVPAVAAAPATALIDSVPWARGAAAVPEPATADTLHADAGTDDDAYQHTVIVNNPQSWGAAAPAGPATPPTGGVEVLGRLCGKGHANPPQQSNCSACGGPLSGEPRDVPRPSLGRVRLSSGEVIELDRALVIGRKPSVSRVQGSDMPRLVSLSNASREVSGSHVEVGLEGWHVMLRDLKSTNGTVLTREGQKPRRLEQGEVAMLVAGDVVQLGGGVSLLFEELR